MGEKLLDGLGGRKGEIKGKEKGMLLRGEEFLFV